MPVSKLLSEITDIVVLREEMIEFLQGVKIFKTLQHEKLFLRVK